MDYKKIWSYYQTEATETFRGSAFRLHYLTQYLEAGQRVLNVGIGGGLFEGFCSERGIDAFSIDPDWLSLRPHTQARKSRLIAGVLEGLPFQDDSFDAVIVSEVLEHLTPEASGMAMSEIRRVLIPGGQIIGTVPSEENLADSMVVCPSCGEVFHKVAHLQSFTCSSMTALLSTLFTDVRCMERAFMAKAAVGRKESVIDLFRNALVRFGVLTREKHIVFRGKKASGDRSGRSFPIGSRARSRAPLAFFLPSLDGGGAERILLNLGATAVSQGHAVDLVVARAGGALAKSIPPNLRVVSLGASRPLTAIPALARYLSAKRPRALLASITNANIAAVWASKLASIPMRCVVREASTLSIELANSSTVNRFLLPGLMRHTFSLAHAVVAPSKAAADDLARVTGIPRDRIQVIYNPVISDEIMAKSKELPDHPWLLQPGVPIIVGMGRLTKQKDFPTLIRAFARMRERIPSRLIIFGDGEDRLALRNLCDELRLRAWVDLPGFTANPYAILSRAALFVLSSRWEGLPGVLIEALACGTRVISTDCPSGPREILDNGRFGQLCPVGDVEAMASAIIRALNGEVDGADSSEWIANFNLKVNAAKYLDLLLG